MNANYERALTISARKTRSGLSVADSLAETQLLPTYLLDIIRTGETTGKLGVCLERFAAILEAEAFTKAAQQFMTIVAVGRLIAIVAAVGGAFSLLHI